MRASVDYFAASYPRISPKVNLMPIDVSCTVYVGRMDAGIVLLLYDEASWISATRAM